MPFALPASACECPISVFLIEELSKELIEASSEEEKDEDRYEIEIFTGSCGLRIQIEDSYNNDDLIFIALDFAPQTIWVRDFIFAIDTYDNSSQVASAAFNNPEIVLNPDITWSEGEFYHAFLTDDAFKQERKKLRRVTPLEAINKLKELEVRK